MESTIHQPQAGPLIANRAANFIEIRDFLMLWTYIQWRQSLVLIPKKSNVLHTFPCSNKTLLTFPPGRLSKHHHTFLRPNIEDSTFHHQTAVAVYRQSDSSDGQTSEWETDAFYKKYSILLLQSARIARSRESDRIFADLWASAHTNLRIFWFAPTANNVCGLTVHPFFQERSNVSQVFFLITYGFIPTANL